MVLVGYDAALISNLGLSGMVCAQTKDYLLVACLCESDVYGPPRILSRISVAVLGDTTSIL